MRKKEKVLKMRQIKNGKTENNNKKLTIMCDLHFFFFVYFNIMYLCDYACIFLSDLS